MTSVARVNDLFGEESLRARQRHDARFINICMMVTLSGAAVSDGLADGRVVSGVGGQYNFVAMAHELERARSILLLRATASRGRDRVEHRLQLRPHHDPAPPARHRHHRVRDRGPARQVGSEIAAALISISDSRFQEELATKRRHRESFRASGGYRSTRSRTRPSILRPGSRRFRRKAFCRCSRSERTSTPTSSV
jgi:hypothetical protein